MRMTLARRHFDRVLLQAEQMTHDRAVPTARRAIDDELEVRKKRGAGHVLCVEPDLCGQDNGVVVGVEVMNRQVGEKLLFLGEGNGGSAGDTGPAIEGHGLVSGQLGPGSDKAHVAAQDVEQLRQLIELKAAQKRPDRGEGLILDRGDLTAAAMGQVGHCSKFEDREALPVAAHALLQEKDRAGRGKPDCQRNDKEDRQKQGQRNEHARAIEQALGRGGRPGAERFSERRGNRVNP